MVKAVRDAKPNKVLRRLRDQQAWAQKDAVTAFNDLAAAVGEKVVLDVNTLSRYERGVITWPDAGVRKVLAALYDVAPDSLGFRRQGSGRPEAHPAASPSVIDGGFDVVSHKFVPAFIGSALVESWAPSMRPVSLGWVSGFVGEVEHPGGDCEVYVFPFRVAVFHIREEKHLPSLGQLAVWRRSSYEHAMAWATGELEQRLTRPADGCPPRAAYVLSLYWLQIRKWHDPAELNTAMGLLSMPSVMLDRTPSSEAEAIHNAEMAEAELFHEGFGHPEIFDFGLRSVSIGCASWAGVSYYALAPRRSLTAQELANFELVVQALWCYSDHMIRCDKEAVAPEYGYRFLRSCQSELKLARAQETTQHRLMRDAVLETSRLPDLLQQAQRVLEERELAPRYRKSKR